MMLGLSLSTFTFLHVAISLIGLATGVVWLLAVTRGVFLNGWNTVFLFTTILTTVTGFMFPFNGFTPTMVVGSVSILVLGVAVLALNVFDREAGWGTVYLMTATIALYLNAFVFVIQAFLKIGPLHALAPEGTEPAFVWAQGAVLAAFVLLGCVAVWRSRRLAF
jgi:hypothetical protein